jgi:Protein  of unknown function (DUF3018)
MQAYRARLRRDGLRLVQSWAPDTASPAYIARCREQSLAVAAHDPGGEAVMRDIEALRDWSGLSNDPA